MASRPRAHIASVTHSMGRHAQLMGEVPALQSMSGPKRSSSIAMSSSVRGATWGLPPPSSLSLPASSFLRFFAFLSFFLPLSFFFLSFLSFCDFFSHRLHRLHQAALLLATHPPPLGPLPL